eukprot:CAMPEP_0115865662 /NCGR_PEP_ID=MMETSP0287-20121206/19839_1 /TAXON_ID=412157 /ORGANISM="Chrysochromulina rotalis, Strain UIO044" /LENGTH=204 /DNA_ID=CAMNT_0003320185 /DNA_START=14 /DNA_END=628 /DNA_ORIENTATION=+
MKTTLIAIALCGAEPVIGLRVRAPPATTTTRYVDRRMLFQNACTAVAVGATLLPATAAHAADSKEAKLVRDTAKQLKELNDQKDAFIAGIIAADDAAPKLPAAIPFTTFQKLESTADPEFMEAAIDYAEANRAAKDLVKLAKLTKQKVQVSTKEPGKPRVTEEVEYGSAPGSNLASTKEYAERAAQEVLGASVALDAAVKAMAQ